MASTEDRLRITYIGAGDLMPLEGNPRMVIDEDGVDKLVTLIEEHGFQNPLQVFKEKDGRYSIICGNHRFKAALELKYKEFPCIVYKGSRAKALARAISDNKSNDWTDWDYGSLKNMMTEIDTGEFDMELTGFDCEELDEMFKIANGVGDEEPGEQTKFPIAIECDSSKERKKLMAKLKNQGIECEKG